MRGAVQCSAERCAAASPAAAGLQVAGLGASLYHLRAVVSTAATTPAGALRGQRRAVVLSQVRKTREHSTLSKLTRELELTLRSTANHRRRLPPLPPAPPPPPLRSSHSCRRPPRCRGRFCYARRSFNFKP